MKSWLVMRDILRYTVAPHAGAWIEISSDFSIARSSSVAPHAGAWIEMRLPLPSLLRHPVAPHAGAWIEICLNTAFILSMTSIVAPHAGAWIEICGLHR